jgi:hypothetical protein
MIFMSCYFQRLIFDQTLSRPAAGETGVRIFDIESSLKITKGAALGVTGGT